MTRTNRYFTVLTNPKFLRANLTDDARREFFAGGDTLVDFMWRTIQLRLSPDFAPTAILGTGCGAGRLAIPLARRAARRAGTVTAVDRSPAMLQTARTEAAAHGVDNITFSAPDELFAGQKRFDFVVCYLVLQRLPPREGLALVRALIERVVPGGIGVFQFPYRTEASSVVNGDALAARARAGRQRRDQHAARTDVVADVHADAHVSGRGRAEDLRRRRPARRRI